MGVEQLKMMETALYVEEGGESMMDLSVELPRKRTPAVKKSRLKAFGIKF